MTDWFEGLCISCGTLRKQDLLILVVNSGANVESH
jgi:hypothetical protein